MLQITKIFGSCAAIHVLFLSFYKLTKYTPHSQSVMMVMTDLYKVLPNKLTLTEGDLKHSWSIAPASISPVK